MRPLHLALAAVLAMTAPAFAADTKPAPKTSQPDKKPAAQDDSQRVICERRHVVGSNIQTKVCKTKAE